MTVAVLRFLLGLAVGFAAGWLILGEASEPELTSAELIEVEILD